MGKIGEIIGWALRGMCMGIANVIPGVSGGTMALVLGIYERLITALNNMGPQTAIIALKACTFKPEAIQAAKDELKRIDFVFVCSIGVGAVAAIVLTADLIVRLLTHQHDPTYAFFCGLILVSIATPIKMMRKFGLAEGAALVVAIGLTLVLVLQMANDQHIVREREKYEMKQEMAAQKAATGELATDGVDHSPKALAWFVACGAIAISAMILPGLSGSFVLLLMGAYFPIMIAVKSRDLVVVAAVGLGCGVGLLLFTRLLKWLFAHFHDATMAVLVGLMLGSLYGLWPFRNFEMIGGERVDGGLIMPAFDGNFWLTVVAFLAGCAVVLGFMVIEKKTGAAEAKHGEDGVEQSYTR